LTDTNSDKNEGDRSLILFKYFDVKKQKLFFIGSMIFYKYQTFEEVYVDASSFPLPVGIFLSCWFAHPFQVARAAKSIIDPEGEAGVTASTVESKSAITASDSSGSSSVKGAESKDGRSDESQFGVQLEFDYILKLMTVMPSKSIPIHMLHSLKLIPLMVTHCCTNQNNPPRTMHSPTPENLSCYGTRRCHTDSDTNPFR
jgi:hypothetical protein